MSRAHVACPCAEPSGAARLVRAPASLSRTVPLRISRPGDAAERQADDAAERVMRGERVHVAAAPVVPLARKCAGCAEAERAPGAPLRGEPFGASLADVRIRAEGFDGERGLVGPAAAALPVGTCAAFEQEKETGQRLETRHRAGPGLAPSSVGDALAEQGRRLEPAIRADMERRFGADFGSVIIHDSELSNRSARQVDAYAYTVGRHVAFAAGRYAPGSLAGRKLLAHELAHVLQQRGSSPVKGQSVRLDSSLRTERAADAAADAALCGRTPNLDGSWTSVVLQRGGRDTCGSGETCCPTDRCATPDTGSGLAGLSNSFQLAVHIDIDRSDWETAVRNQEFGHTFVDLSESIGRRYTYGFYPAGALPNENRRQVPGCVRHPDTTHSRCVEDTLRYTLSAVQYQAALDRAQTICRTGGYYGVTYTCTTFANDVVTAAGQTMPSSRSAPTTVYMQGIPPIANPNTLLENVQAERAQDPNRRSPFWNNPCLNACEAQFNLCISQTRTALGPYQCMARRSTCYSACRPPGR